MEEDCFVVFLVGFIVHRLPLTYVLTAWLVYWFSYQPD